MCRQAAAEVGIDLAKSVHKHAGDLTAVELIRLIEGVAHGYIMGLTKSMLRQERHGDTDKPADLE